MMTKAPVILFADRELSWSRDARVRLRRLGAEVHMATTVDDALRLAAAKSPDLLILDDDLDGRGTLDLVEVFSEALPQAELILLESEVPGIPRGSGRGLFYSGAKPVSPTLLFDLAQTALEGRLPDEPEMTAPPRRSTVLCIDDDAQYLRSVSRFLNRHGYEVSTFQSAEGALQAIPQLKPDIALVDVMMPGMGGLDLAQKIRETTRGHTPVVFLTALDSEEVFYEGHARGGVFMIGKSEKPQKVLDVVDYFAGDLDESERALIKSRL
ncbi:MAG TPA: response regulator [Planctomycetota bacterium]|nr:response regulator [Planctomycetota bacterium]